MGSPQNPRARAREKARRARKNAVYDAKKAAEAKTGGAAPAIAKGAASAPAAKAPAAKSATK